MEQDVSQIAIAAIAQCDDFFLNIKILLQIFATLSVYTAIRKRTI